MPPFALQAVACFSSKAHLCNMEEHFIGRVTGLVKVGAAHRDASYTKFQAGEWVLELDWLYLQSDKPLHYSTSHPKGKSTADVVHLDSLITVLNASRSHHIPLPIELRSAGQLQVLSDTTHSMLMDRSQIDLYQGRDPAAKA